MKQKDISEQFSTLKNVAEGGNELKDYIINYVGNEKDPEDDQVTVEMIIDILARDFPQLILCISEENWVRGYQQALTDVEEGERLFNEELSKSEE
jgi:hypothetical protein